MAQNRTFACAWRFAGLALGIAALVINLINAAKTGRAGMQFYYFTVQTNIFVTVLFAVLAVKTAVQIKREGRNGPAAHINYCLQTAVVLYIVITFLVFWLIVAVFAIADEEIVASLTVLSVISNFMVHAIVPFMAVADWVVFAPHGGLSSKCALIWLIYPFAYGVMLIMRAIFGGPFKVTQKGSAQYFPYPFMEPSTLAKLKICQNGLNPYALFAFVCALLLLLFYILGCFMIELDNKLAKDDMAGRQMQKLENAKI